jgi:hypothetical protein
VYAARRLIYDGAVEDVTRITHAVRTLARLGLAASAAKNDLAEREGKQLASGDVEKR